MQCELPPGHKLVIREIAVQLEVSSIPVREAIQLLHSEDLVDYNPHVGAIVSPITKGAIVETFTIKEGLESAATRIAMQKMTKSGLHNLEKQLAEMDKVLKSRHFDEWGQRNAEFHSNIVNITAMSTLKEMHLKVLDKWDRIHRYFFSEVLVNSHSQSQDEHYAIVDAIANDNSEKAEQLTRLHNRNALRDYMEFIEE
jgi:DNA-binding GntR family transcriptional regulator